MNKLYTFCFNGPDINSLSFNADSLADPVSHFKSFFGESMYNSLEPLITTIYIYD